MGKANEEPLSFTVRPINLIVGPNNAGKSLFLRELSGINPRRERGRTHIRPQTSFHHVKSTKIVAVVEWSAERVAEDRRQIIEAVLGGEDKEAFDWASGIPVRPWDDLLPALERASEALVAQRIQVVSTIWEGAVEFLPKELSALLPKSLEMEGDGAEPMLEAVLGLGVFGLVIGKSSIHEQASLDEEAELRDGQPFDDDVPEPSAEVVVLPAALKRLEGVLRGYWEACVEIVGSLGIPEPGVSFGELSDLRVLGGLLHSKLGEMSVFGTAFADVLGREFGASPSPAVDLAGLERALKLVDVFVDPSRLRSLASCLEKIERDYSWSNPKVRREFSGQVLYLDGLTRLAMTAQGKLSPYDKEAGDGAPVLELLKSEHNRKLLRTVVAEVLGAHLVIDMVSQAPKVLWKLSPEAPPDGLEARYEQETQDFVSRAIDLDERSDGIHAIVGMFAAMFAKAASVVLIDEPEAFLHPPLIRKFARQLAEIAKNNDFQFFVATHSPELLAGFAPNAQDINILRLSYDDRGEAPVATARLLHRNALRRLALDPLLRSESALSALFCEGAVVCEAPADRTLYQEVNERLVLYGEPGDGLESCAFLNAQNWQTVGRMIRPLREMSVAAATVLDADVLFGKDLTRVLEAAQIPKAIRKTLLQLRGDFKTSVRDRVAQAQGLDDDARDKIKLKHDLITDLTGDERETFEHLIDVFGQYGVFIVPLGELECWLTPLGLTPNTDKKRKWLEEALERLGWDPDLEGYVKPQAGDVWDFMRRVAAWIADPQRKGTAPAD
ncbi:hypothetical protein ENSA5_14180 [Enhygromyxa salina]|uniref:ATPase AAA-type core domain-containing protein n=1 Tax=Enhygromyxa salina TaxID=215803 RepID=A0A2S9YES4_9BACT|nr:AAA family ATPase [Enhygromyxa salina]PRQ03615.1 hypothetical protein ENSA5_14180 [Enhygromyxa salina]